MERRPREPSQKPGADRFVGDVWIDTLVMGEPPSRIRVTQVHFAPAARTAWHSHAVGQTLHVTEGVGRAQSRGGDRVEMRAGDTVHTPPGEWHWHGAAPEQFMTHLAMWEAPDDGDEAEWGEHVSDTDYGR